MQRVLLSFSAIVLATVMATPSASAAASRDSKQCSNFIECLFGGSSSNGSSSFNSGRADYGPSTRKLISFPQGSELATGTIIIDTSERNLYLIQPGGKAYKYRVGVGRQGFQ